MSRRGHRAMRYRPYVCYGNRTGHSSHRTLKGLALLALLAIATPLAVFSGNDAASSRGSNSIAHPIDAPQPLTAASRPAAVTAAPRIEEADAATITEVSRDEVASNATEPAPAEHGTAHATTMSPSAAHVARTSTATPRARITHRAPARMAVKRHAVIEERAAAPTKWEVRVDDNARPGDGRPAASWRKGPIPGVETAAVRRGVG